MADLRGASPQGPKLSVFHIFSLKMLQNRMLMPPLRGSAPPPTGKPGSAPERYV